MTVAKQDVRLLAERARAASRVLANVTTGQKDEALRSMARHLRAAAPDILSASAEDVAAARGAGKNAAFLDRLLLDAPRLEAMARAVESLAGLKDPVGEVTESWSRPNGLQVRKVRLPLGVVLMIYEARPNVTSDAAALCLKSGNAALLRGGSEAARTNQAIARALSRGLGEAGLPEHAIQQVPAGERESLLELLKLEGLIDLCIPRGGEGLIRFVAENARIPVVKHYQGVCHVYAHAAADLEMASRITLNAKASRPGVCNAAECLLVDRAIAEQFLPEVGRKLVDQRVELRGCPTTVAVLTRAGVPVKPAAEEDYGREFLDLILAIRVVKDEDAALAHIARYGSEHTEAIVTQDEQVAARFTREVLASAVIWNASTRFNDGGELGLGAEIGISTSRLHAFGPMGLRELTSQKYVVHGQGQVR
ncbi:glutamate-5-semialdehyde dehydrogenase [Stigmatella aurantiaca]|uniref:Gamma-glutamyl phosphate reductase n=1 Tax=Stigmatella aurantiaca (strain DW4/3-1) TaxID=378806 RepID=Q08NZ4_STIAD|nr:glutamate-5-semialdehyde dehydrogenase [Stigmatella aurantiaca]ADO69660.1 Gamma-glutamyl phosphate reductase [Stigmatella aurantiaca DW4/3-1]EAU62201.1 gamma-glutamyl phosphate reductase [Stigmatella aurantiaca DW4/3-1]